MGPPAAGTADTAGTGRTGGTGGPGEARGAGGDTSGGTTGGGTGSSRGSRADGGEGERIRQQLCPILIQKKAIGMYTGFAPKRPKDNNPSRRHKSRMAVEEARRRRRRRSCRGGFIPVKGDDLKRSMDATDFNGLQWGCNVDDKSADANVDGCGWLWMDGQAGTAARSPLGFMQP